MVLTQCPYFFLRRVRLTGRVPRREDAIEDALSNKLAQRALKREADAAARERQEERARGVMELARLDAIKQGGSSRGNDYQD